MADMGPSSEEIASAKPQAAKGTLTIPTIVVHRQGTVRRTSSPAPCPSRELASGAPGNYKDAYRDPLPAGDSAAMNAQTTCPKCASTEVHFRQSRNDWVCDVCEHHWVPESPTKTDGSTKARARLFLSYG